MHFCLLNTFLFLFFVGIIHNQKCDLDEGRNIGQPILDLIHQYRAELHITIPLYSNYELVSLGKKIVEEIIINTNSFGKHENFESRSKEIEDMKYYSEAIAVVENNNEYSENVMDMWKKDQIISTDMLREYEEGEVFCCHSGQSLYCALTLAKYEKKYE